jgi:hypothetical protein
MTDRIVVSGARLGALLASIVLAATANAQITYSRNDEPHTVGDSFMYKYCTVLSPINVGEPGGPQTWEFDTSTYVGELTNLVVVALSSTPFEAEFPTANIVHRGHAAGSQGYSLAFQEITDDVYTRLGTGLVQPDTSTCCVYNPTQLVYTLPLHFGDEWRSEFSFTGGGGPFRIVTWTWGNPRADAWGMATTPVGTASCLRVNSYDTTAIWTYMNDTLINTDTVGYRTMLWLVPGRGVVVFATGPENDTSNHFTETNCYRVMVAAGSGVAEEPSSWQRRALSAAPNPCTDHAVFALPPGASTTAPLTIRDRAGRTVRTLVVGESRVVRWNAADDSGAHVAPGVYFCSAGSTRPLKLVVSD